MKDVFVDPSVVSPRELTANEMNQVTGGIIPVVVVTACSETLVAGVGIVVIHVID